MCAFHMMTGGVTKINVLPAFPATASTISCVKVPDLHLPGHDPVSFALNFQSSAQVVRKERKLPPPNVPTRADKGLERGAEPSTEEAEA